ncbi:unnamed protein product [Diatraea saccharalis]|uniref:Uncharacterized protein n=1 Tax=Diatraea saccharalis TaxID=40085 RepID=A0A9N9R6L4_9NEOP|nr:unnamed protein product [Diatraea saccharalis]
MNKVYGGTSLPRRNLHFHIIVVVDCPCAGDNPLIPGQPPTGAETNTAAANKDRIASNGQVFPWRGARLPTFVIPKHYSLWLHPNLTTGELRGEVSIDFKLDRDTSFVVLNVRDMNVTERALFKTGGALGPKVARALDYPAADQTYIEFKLQDEFVESLPMPPHMVSLAVCRLQRVAAPPPPAPPGAPTPAPPTTPPPTSTPPTTEQPDDEVLPPPEISLYNIVVVESGNAYSEGWGLIILAPATLSDTKTIARLLAQQGAAIVSMAIEAAGEEAGRAALARLLKYHRAASADARDLWRALQHDGGDDSARAHAWDGWCERPGYPLLSATTKGDDIVLRQERFIMTADPPAMDAPVVDSLLTADLRSELDELFYEPDNITDTLEDDLNATTTAAPTTTTRRVPTTRAPPAYKWVIPLTFVVGPVEDTDEEDLDNITKIWRNVTENMQNGTW